MARRGFPRDESPAVAEFSGARLKAARERRAMSQRSLAEAMGCHVDAVRAWEAGTEPMREKTLRLLCFFLGVAADCLMDPPIGQGAGV